MQVRGTRRCSGMQRDAVENAVYAQYMQDMHNIRSIFAIMWLCKPDLVLYMAMRGKWNVYTGYPVHIYISSILCIVPSKSANQTRSYAWALCRRRGASEARVLTPVWSKWTVGDSFWSLFTNQVYVGTPQAQLIHDSASPFTWRIPVPRSFPRQLGVPNLLFARVLCSRIVCLGMVWFAEFYGPYPGT